MSLFMSGNSMKIKEFRAYWPYLENYYGSCVRYYDKWFEEACENGECDYLTLDTYYKNPSLEIFPDDMILSFEMPYYFEIISLCMTYDQFYRSDVTQVLLLAPYNHPKYHPKEEQGIDKFLKSEERDIQSLLEFLQMAESEGKATNLRLSLSSSLNNGSVSIVIENHTRWLSRASEAFIDEQKRIYRNSPAEIVSPILPKRRPPFESYLAYNTLRFLRSIFEIKAFLPQELCEFICRYVNIVLRHLADGGSDNMSPAELSYNKIYTMLNNDKKSYGDTSIPVHYIKK